ncbi:hypothetical protein HYDPIDRAFT_109999 [Hydnomerulius pinastri MD-312]|nr:hypothetical protein HYDPIDRAFT_109999 [Hydnomerulius pinastri MD-312]
MNALSPVSWIHPHLFPVLPPRRRASTSQVGWVLMLVTVPAECHPQLPQTQRLLRSLQAKDTMGRDVVSHTHRNILTCIPPISCKSAGDDISTKLNQLACAMIIAER